MEWLPNVPAGWRQDGHSPLLHMVEAHGDCRQVQSLRPRLRAEHQIISVRSLLILSKLRTACVLQ